MAYTYQYPHMAVTVDAAMLRRREGAMEILLIQRKHDPYAGHWALPGGFVDMDERLEPAARRELLEETGITAGELNLLGVFDAVDRDPRERTISIIYWGWAPDGAAEPRGRDDAADAAWHSLDALPPLAFDQ